VCMNDVRAYVSRACMLCIFTSRLVNIKNSLDANPWYRKARSVVTHEDT